MRAVVFVRACVRVLRACVGCVRAGACACVCARVYVCVCVHRLGARRARTKQPHNTLHALFPLSPNILFPLRLNITPHFHISDTCFVSSRKYDVMEGARHPHDARRLLAVLAPAQRPCGRRDGFGRRI